MLIDAKLPTYFWAEAVKTACFVQNCSLVNAHGKTPYEMIKRKKPNVKYFHIFGCKCFVLKVHPEMAGKFEAKFDEAIFLGYSSSSKAYRVFNLRKQIVMESIHVAFDDKRLEGYGVQDEHEHLQFENQLDDEEETSEVSIESVPPQEEHFVEGELDNLTSTTLELEQTQQSEEQATEHQAQNNSTEGTIINNLPPSIKWTKDHPETQIIGDINSGVQTRRMLEESNNEHMLSCFLSKIEPKKVEEALEDPDWIVAM